MNTTEIMLSIGDVSRFLSIPTHTLRYWEKEFSNYLTPRRTDGKQRRYSDMDIEVIKKIKALLKDEGYSLAGAKKILSMQSNTNINPTINKDQVSIDIADSIARMIKDKLAIKDETAINAA